ncbi:MAG: GldG family protein [Acidobacteria bacterium]|nr:GldG family protein [Acidobacteriota bacterium]
MQSKSVRLALVLIILALAYGISRYAYFRLDLTAARQFTLSDPTKRVLKRLDAPLTIKVYFSEQMPIAFRPVVSYLRDMFGEYQQASELVLIDYIDPANDEELTRQAFALGLEKVKANVTEKGRMELAEVWFGFVLIYKDQKKVFPSVGEVQNFEYDVTSAILRLAQQELPHIFFVGPGLDTQAEHSSLGHSFDKDMAHLGEVLSSQYNLTHHDTSQVPLLNLSDADMLIVWGVHAFSDEQLYDIDQHLMHGKPAVFLAPGVAVDPLRLKAREIPQSRFDDYLDHLGVRISRNLVADNQAQMIRRTEDNRPVVIQYPLFPLLSAASGGFDPTYAPTSSMSNLLLPWPSETQLVAKDSSGFQIIARSSAQSWALEKEFPLNPERVPGPHSFATFDLGIAYSGPATSFFSAELLPPSRMAYVSQHITSVDHVQWLVVGTDHLLGQYQNPSTAVFLSNVANDMLGNKDLAGIARRESSFRPLNDVTDKHRTRLRWISVLLGPVLVMIWAVSRQIVRQRRNLDVYRS